MIRKVSKEVWSAYERLLPKEREAYRELPLPTTLDYQGEIRGSFRYVPPESLLGHLRSWLKNRGEGRVYYFTTEYTPDEEGLFELDLADLTQKTLSEINRNLENILLASDFSWVLFLDHEGTLHVAGPKELLLLLQECTGTS